MRPGHPALLVHDDRVHGVARYALELARAIESQLGAALAVEERAWASSSAPVAHAHFTDRLWGPSPEDAAARFESLSGGRAMTVTLHDVPQPSDGHAAERRRSAYRRVLDAATRVVVNSDHERMLLLEADLDHPDLHVIPLPAAAPRHPLRSLEPVVAVLGFVYPGKGHREVIHAVAASGTGLDVLAVGGPSPGHEQDAAELVRLGERLGVRVAVTGFVDDAALLEAAASAAVPVLAHQHISASGSLNTWLAAGRRPVVLSSRYTREMHALRPGTLALVSPERLPDAIARAAADPASTLLAPDAITAPHLHDVARGYVRLWAAG